MDGLSAAASVVGLVAAALQSVHALSRTIDDIKGAPSEVQATRRDLGTLTSIFGQLDLLLRDGDHDRPIKPTRLTISTATDSCRLACDGFQYLLKHWLRHSTEDQMFWADRWRIGLFGVSRTKAFRERLADHKATLALALQTECLLRLTAEDTVSEDERDKKAKVLEVDARTGLERAIIQSEEIENDRQLIMVKVEDIPPIRQGATVDLRRDIERDFEVLREANRQMHRACEESLKTAAVARAAQRIQGVKATNDSTALAGYINTEDLGTIDQDIRNVTADQRSVAVAGVAKGVDFGSLFTKK
ncbi:hypothetical protein ACHAQH_002457 [Verticillium albo-atrum]